MMQTALQRWHELLDARARQMDAAYARLGRSSADYWNRRAHGFHRATKAMISGDPLFLKLRELSLSQNSVLDVGAGTGRFALALAPHVKQVIAVEPNEAMLNYLRQDAAEQGISTITYIPTTWQEVPAELRADIVICSHVLYPIRDVDVFLAKLRDATLRTCYIYLRATHFDELTAPLWRHFHGDERCLPPGYIHALDVMYELGMYAKVEIVKVPQSMRFLSLGEAVGTMQEQLILPDDERTRDELRNQLANWLVERDGMLTPPVDEMVCAIVSWQP